MLPSVIQTGWLLASPENSIEPGLWFIFHAEEDGILAVDLTTAHPDIAYAPFRSALSGMDRKSESEQIVLLGGSVQADDALIILHNKAASDKDSHVLTEDFAFKSYRYRLIPGKPPAITTKDSAPTSIHFPGKADFLVIIGFRLWDIQTLQQELAAGLWTLLPATPDIVFQTPREARRTRALNLLN